MGKTVIHRRRKKFPTFAFIVMIFAIVWFLSELEMINLDVPWLPLILIVISFGWVFNRLI